jgi:hypothetical protein
MKRSFLVCIAAAALLADGNGGIPPRNKSSDYPAHQTTGDLTLSAELLSPAEAKKVFTADLDHAGYLVFEVAAFPENGAQIDVAPDQFTLRSANDTAIVPTSSPDSIVEAMYKGKRSTVPRVPGKVQVYNTATIGYESGGPGRRGGVYTGGSTTVGVGNPPAPPPTPASSKPAVDRDTLFAELSAREFPGARTSTPVAGYVYFAKPGTRPKNGVYELTYIFSGLNGQNIVLQVPAKTAR